MGSIRCVESRMARLAVAGWDGRVRWWNADGVALGMRGREGAPFRGVDWQFGGKRFAAAWKNKILIYNTETKDDEPETMWSGHEADVWVVAWSPDGRRLVSGGGADKTVRVWDIGRSEPNVLQGHTGSVTSVAWSLDGTTIASTDSKGEIRLWAADGTLCRSFAGNTEGRCGIAFSPDSQRIAGCCEPHGVRIWSLDGELNRDYFVTHVPQGGEQPPAWSPDGTRLATGLAGHLAIWKADTEEKCPVPVTDVNWGLLSLSWSRDGQDIACDGLDGVVRVWNVQAGQVQWVSVPFRDSSVTCNTAGQILDGDPVTLKDQLVYVVQPTPDGPQELWTYQQFADYVTKQGMDIFAKEYPTEAKKSAGPADRVGTSSAEAKAGSSGLVHSTDGGPEAKKPDATPSSTQDPPLSLKAGEPLWPQSLVPRPALSRAASLGSGFADTEFDGGACRP